MPHSGSLALHGVKPNFKKSPLNCDFAVAPKSFCHVIGIHLRFDPAPFLPTYLHIFMK